MITYLKKRRRFVATFLLTVFIGELFIPLASYGLTSGPGQPEVQGFKPAGMSDMVDLFSGDFSYNIPLFELPGPNGGYPFNLSYQSGIAMDQEASWVGLGWSLNPGAINRQIRGLPDEFSDETIETKMSIKESVTVGVGVGASLEIFGGEKKGASLNVGLSVYDNNYRGFGYTIDASFGYSAAVGDKARAGANLGLSLDSQEGVNISPSLSLRVQDHEIGVGVGYNASSGLSRMSITHDYSANKSTEPVQNMRNGKVKQVDWSTSMSQSASISLAHPGYTPQITMPMISKSLSARIKGGGAWWGVFGSPWVMGFYNSSKLRHDGKWIRSSGFGYLNLHQDLAKSRSAILDFNREKDGIVSKETPNLAIPFLTYDVYSVNGQGISAMYRPVRNDLGWVFDAESVSESIGTSAGVDFGPAAHVGVNLSFNMSKSITGPWDGIDNQFIRSFAFKKGTIDSPYEPWHFKVHGEMTSENTNILKQLGADKAITAALDNSGGTTKQVKTSHHQLMNLPNNLTTPPEERKSRNQLVQPITNSQLLGADQKELIPSFKINYYEGQSTILTPYRRSWPTHHHAGFTALTPEGLQYVYALPAYNLAHEEVMFSGVKPADNSKRYRSKVNRSGDVGDPFYKVSGTDQFLKRVKKPKYAHSYLLTAILGTDYVDVLGDGVTEDDLGYWVKFTYRRVADESNPFRWRDPFSGAHYEEGWKSDLTDDKASFTAGKKEIWYLERAETKSHIAEFELIDRLDGLGAASLFQDEETVGDVKLKALKSITLYTRHAQAFPLKKIDFTYSYDLCKNVENSSIVNGTEKGGKLTLTKLQFFHGKSNKGGLNPYEFKYYGEEIKYDNHAYDRWGNYKPYPSTDRLHNQDFPYVDQDPNNKPALDAQVAAWSLKEITLPSKGKILIDYETDDYAYVQHKQAMQMVEILNPEQGSQSIQLKDDNTRIYFKLQRPIAGLPATQKETADIIREYLPRDGQDVFFRICTNVAKPHSNPALNLNEVINCYASISPNDNDMGIEQLNGEYVGWFKLKTEKGNGKSFHPLKMRAWQHMRTNQPDLTKSTARLEPASSAAEQVKRIKSLGAIVRDIKTIFEGFYNHCDDLKWGWHLKPGKSWVRLNSINMKKFGGGLRVKQITMKDPSDHESVYGQVYDYEIDENGRTISSGVASYEPLVGGEENPLRYAKKYTQSVPLRADNNLYFEYPINESYFPGPGVGYRKVTVFSLPAAYRAGKTVNHIGDDQASIFPAGKQIGTSGATVHEFYTAKEFPVITDETEKQNYDERLAILIPFAGSTTLSKLSTSQGYSIVTNDMHGKLKMVSNFRQDASGQLEKEPISWVRHNYASEKRFLDKIEVSTVVNEFKEVNGMLQLLNEDERKNPPSNTFTVGQEWDFFSDSRRFDDRALGGGVNLNLDLVYAFVTIPVFVGMPSLSADFSELNMCVTNKVIFKSGILESTEAYDGGSRIKTNNLAWDKQTGATLLTTVNNNFNEPIYNYSIPAYSQYQGMGAAFQNTGLEFIVSNIRKDTYQDNYYYFTSPLSEKHLVRGDEIILSAIIDGERVPVAKAVYTGRRDTDRVIFSNVALSETEYSAMIVRSGYRNQLSVTAGSITSLNDPSIKSNPVTFQKNMLIQK